MNQKILRTGLAMIILCCLSSFIGLQIQVLQPKASCDQTTKCIVRHDTLEYSVKDGCLTAEGNDGKVNVLFLLW